MDLRARIFVIILSLGILTFVINLVRRKNLKENYAILWVVTCIVLTTIPLFINYLDKAAYAIGIYYPPAFIYLIAMIFILVLILHFSVIVSKLSEHNKNLIQDQGILEKKFQDLEAQLQQGSAAKQNGEAKNLKSENQEIEEAQG